MEFSINKDFLIDGQPTKLISGAVHYFRLSPEKWEQSLKNLLALGANTVETYVPWNLHEPRPGQFNFEEEANICEFLTLAQNLGLYIIVRPSPYICAEWDFGGLPSWLLKQPIRVRSQDPAFLGAVERYFSVLLPKLLDYQVTAGGTLLMMQVENEYGSYSDDKNYLREIAALMRKEGVTVPLFTSDGGWDAVLNAGNMLEDNILPTVNFGSDVKENFSCLSKKLKEFKKAWPLMCMEFWDGWFTHVGGERILRDPKETAEEVRQILQAGSINLYMFHGGTNYGFYNGANYYFDKGYLPQTTSYDYDALLDEAGNPTPKFYAIQQVIKETVPEQAPEPLREPVISAAKAYSTVKCKEKVDLFSALPDIAEKVVNDTPLTMEELNQSFGYLLYKLQNPLQTIGKHELRIVGLNDRGQVFVNNQHAYTRDWKTAETPFELSITEGTQLAVLTENMGRVNYGPYLVSEQQKKGIRGGLMQDHFYLSGWEHYCLEFSKEQLSKLNFNRGYRIGRPAFYRFELNISQRQDTYVKIENLGKGVLFLNGKNMGRYWDKGPSLTLYLDRYFLKEGTNELLIFETEGVPIEELQFSDHAIWSDHASSI